MKKRRKYLLTAAAAAAVIIPAAATLSCWTVNREWKLVRTYCQVIGERPARVTEMPEAEATELIFYPIVESGPTSTPKATQAPYPYPWETVEVSPYP